MPIYILSANKRAKVRIFYHNSYTHLNSQVPVHTIFSVKIHPPRYSLRHDLRYIIVLGKKIILDKPFNNLKLLREAYCIKCR